ncbi:hypothetical protein RHGRI_009823 [Rhododendron griersonianum]|uniref:non-specific serine/threonine protein kinase n=1 Tax=Rhododendron griersonianum TaxID=479676 RepID=A0AAV6KG81_9ERIC|nr:hypothetical protein RHGRI_009823 [Rhododendron griersonianum]
MKCICGKETGWKKISSLLVVVSLLSSCFTDFRSVDAQLLPQEEVQALEAISAKLQIQHWNITRNFCRVGFQYEGSDTAVVSNVTCDCTSANATVCHVTNIQLKALNLRGTLPAEFANLTFLEEIDLTRNYINGTLPTNFAKLPLTILGLLGNRINGSIPREIGDIATLEELVLLDNQLGGPLPQSLGSLTRLRRLLLSANNFTGAIPEEYSKLTNLTDFRIDGSTLSGKIPDMIGNWTKIERLDMQGTSVSGPIPSTISELINLEELRISDLNGSDMTFPDLQNMTKLKYLVLRNCLITGPIPDYIGDLPALKYLDLSFNNLSGQIPGSLQSSDLDIMRLGCKLFAFLVLFDFQYYMSSRSHPLYIGQQEFSFQPFIHREQLVNHSLYINCGGSRIKAEGNEYEEDLAREGPSYFFASSQRWAYSSTGFFMNNLDANYLANYSFSLKMTGAEYYKTARLAPNSLKYYGLCLRKGSYKVRLHFAEIMYSDDQTYSSLGRRIFDVSIQGKEVLKDFNIKEVAKGVGIGITREFDDILVNGSTLEIHLYWRGKGTTSIPDRETDFPLPLDFDVSTGLSAGAIVGIVVASFVFLVLILVAYVLQEQGTLLELVDPSLGSNYSKEEALNMLQIGLLCTNPSPTLRPAMSSVVSMLEGKLPIQATLIKRTTVTEEMRFKAFERLTQDSQTHTSSTFSLDSRGQSSISMNAPSSIDTSVTIQSKNDDLSHSPSGKLLEDLSDVKRN